MDRVSVSSVDRDEIFEVSEAIYRYAELGSQEYKSSELLVSGLRKHGFQLEFPYSGMKTAFRARYGSGSPSIGLLAEYDALPNGHSCGHNIISSWAYGTAVTLSKVLENGTVTVYGTPSEEGIGEYAGSKVVLADSGVFRDLDVMFGCHPDDKWAVGSTALSDITLQFIFEGKASHAADAPHEGINALDAAVMTYQGINNLRSWIKADRHPVIGMLFREAGTAVNVVPDRAVLEVDVRSTSGTFLKTLVEKVKMVARGCAEAIGAKLTEKEVTPLYQDYKNNETLNDLLYRELGYLGINAEKTDTGEVPSGSTDEANVSKVVPTGHIDICISNKPIPGHSDQFRTAADPKNAIDNLISGVVATVNACIALSEEAAIVDKARKEFLEDGEGNE